MFGKMWLFFGCRQRALDLYREEKAAMLKEGVLDKVYLALSREPTIPKVTEDANSEFHVSMGCSLHKTYMVWFLDMEFQ